MGNTAVRLLVTAGGLMMLAGCIFAFARHWGYTALLWVGALGCAAAAFSVMKRGDK